MRISWISPLTLNTSYGSSAINIVTALTELGHEVALFPIGPVQLDKECSWTHQPIIKGIELGKYNYGVEAPCIRFYHQFSQAEFVGRGPRVAWSIFELDKFTRLEIAQLSRVDHLISCSRWSDDVIQSEIIDREYEKAIHSNFRGGREIKSSVVPLGVDSRVFNPKTTYRDGTTLIHIAKTEIRKSSREIVECFNKAFTKDDDIKLLLAWTNIFDSPREQEEWNRFAKAGPIGDKIEILPRFESCKQVSSMIDSCDALVSMSKAEGWGLPQLESMASGKHVITTVNTAQSEFCNTNNSLVIECDETEKAFDNRWFLGRDFPGEPGHWAKIGQSQKDQLINHMREIHRRKQEGTLGINNEGLATSQTFSWKHSAETLIQVLESL